MPAAAPAPPRRRGRFGVHVFLSVVSLAFLAPLLLAVYASLRPYEETAKYGYFSLPRHLSFDYYAQAFVDSGMAKYFVNSLLIAVPGVLLTLFLASFVAFAVSRLRMRGGIVLLMVFTAGNLLPQQVIVTPLYVLFNKIPLPYWMSDSMTMYDSLWAVIAVQVAFQTRFLRLRARELHARPLPREILEAAVVDGAGVWAQYWRVTLPLCRPALAALGTLQFTWMYNDFLWALVLHLRRRQAPRHLRPEQSARPVLHRLQPARGRFRPRRAAHDPGLPAAAAALHRRADPRREQGLAERRTKAGDAVMRRRHMRRTARCPGRQLRCTDGGFGTEGVGERLFAGGFAAGDR